MLLLWTLIMCMGVCPYARISSWASFRPRTADNDFPAVCQFF